MLKKTDPDIIKSYLEDTSHLPGGSAEGVYLPASGAEVLEAVKECAAKQTLLTVSAAETGTTGGCIPFGGWVLTTRNLTKVIDFNPEAKTATFEPGISLTEIDKLV